MSNYPRPYIVALWLSDMKSGNMYVRVEPGVTEYDATARAVSHYYTQSGMPKLPVCASVCLPVTREACLANLAVLDAADAYDKTETERVTPIRPATSEAGGSPNFPADPPPGDVA